MVYLFLFQLLKVILNRLLEKSPCYSPWVEGVGSIEMKSAIKNNDCCNKEQQEIGCKQGLQYTPRKVHIKTL